MNRIGETNYNNFGSEIIIVGYRKYNDIDVYFPEYDWTIEHIQYGQFKKGNIRCPYERRVYGVGYLGEGDYKTKENNKHTKIYERWHSVMQRCYDPKWHIKQPTYIGCKVAEEWYNFQNFAQWFEENYYEIEGKIMDLDKDILIKGNKIYSPDTCVFVPQEINKLFIKSDITRGNLPIGVSYDKPRRKYKAQYSMNGQKTYIGLYNTPEEAFQAYKQFKENLIQELADEYQYQIPEVLYDAMYNYRVERDD